MNLWDFKAGFYDFSRTTFPFNLILQKELDCVRKLVGDLKMGDGFILDIGCGSGTTWAALPDSVKLVALDSSSRMLLHLPRRTGGHSIRASASFLPFKSDSFFLVSAIGLSEYLEDLELFVSEARRVTAQSGYLLVTCTPRKGLNWLRLCLGQRLHFISSGSLRRLLEQQGMLFVAQEKALIQNQILMQKI